MFYRLLAFFLILLQYENSIAFDFEFLFKDIKISDINNIAKSVGISIPGPNENSDIGKLLYSLGIDKYVKNLQVDKIPELLSQGLGSDTPNQKEPEEFDLSYYFKNITAEDLPKMLIRLLKVGSQNASGTRDDNQLFAMQETFSKIKCVRKIIKLFIFI